jgi:hypothetical protein
MSMEDGMVVVAREEEVYGSQCLVAMDYMDLSMRRIEEVEMVIGRDMVIWVRHFGMKRGKVLGVGMHN